MSQGLTGHARDHCLAQPGLTLERMEQEGCFAPLDLHFARLCGRLAASRDPDLLLTAALVSSRTNQGHVCLDLSALKDIALDQAGALALPGIDPDLLADKLGSLAVVGSPGEFTPLVLSPQGRLYLHRYWEYESDLARGLVALATHRDHPLGSVDPAALARALQELFPGQGGTGPDWQRVAACTALTRRLTVITGGPGTGKTSTVARIIALLLGQPHGPGLKIALAAPTGKAAARLTESIQSARAGLRLPREISELFPAAATTLHRLLGARSGTATFVHGPDYPLEADVVIVDEASMVDLPLMARLVRALPPSASLILLGDKDQLASVEAGAVLGDICSGPIRTFSPQGAALLASLCGHEPARAAEHTTSPLLDSVVQLERSYRFDPGSGIGRLSSAVIGGDPDAALDTLLSGAHPDLSWHPLPEASGLEQLLQRTALPELSDLVLARDPDRAFALFGAFQLLCAVRQGPYGIVRCNSLLERLLQARGLVPPGASAYSGKPVMVQRNDYQTGLFNGDVGIFQHSEEGLRVVFSGREEFRRLTPARLPAHEPVYAMTVHKSQGSEFDRVLIILPDAQSPLLTRELLYTALTRARRHVTLAATEKTLRASIARRTERASGLRELLWGDHASPCASS